jgi:hypothetical protein
MVDIPQTVSDDDFKHILRSINLPPDADLEGFRSNITAIGETFRTKASDLAGFPTLSKLKKKLNKTIKTTTAQIQAYEDLYSREFEDKTYIAIPDWIKPITRPLEEAGAAAENLLKNYPEIKKGPDPDLAFKFMFRDLVELYEKHTGRNATSTPQDADTPTEFQNFVWYCNQGFLTSDQNEPFELVDSFPQKVHKALIDFRKAKATNDST